MRGIWIYVAALLVLIGIGSREPAPTAVGAVILLTGGVSRLWSRASLAHVDYVRTVPTRRAFVGESVEVAFSLTNRKALPLPWVEIRDSVPERAPPEDEPGKARRRTRHVTDEPQHIACLVRKGALASPFSLQGARIFSVRPGATAFRRCIRILSGNCRGQPRSTPDGPSESATAARHRSASTAALWGVRFRESDIRGPEPGYRAAGLPARRSAETH